MTDVRPHERGQRPREVPLEEVSFNRPFATGDELEYVHEAVRNLHLSGNGPFTALCTQHLESQLGSGRVLLTHSCTGALEMAMLLAGIGPGDEVIMPSFAFASLPNAVALRGGVPVFVDIRPDTLNVDERLVEDAITSRTRAIAPVDYAGVGCEMETFAALAKERDLVVVEDAAQGLDASYRGRPLGVLSDAACISFHETKNVMCGEGGALLVNRPEWTERAEIIQEKGTNRSQFFRGQVDKYTWVDLGSSYLVSDLAAAFLWAQLEHASEITSMRRAVWDAYHEALEELEAAGRLRRPVVPPHCAHNGHLYYLLLEPGMFRDRFIEYLQSAGVKAVFHYVPLHSSPAGRRFGRVHGSLAMTDDVSERLVRLPLWVGMDPAMVERVTGAVRDALARD